MEFRTYLDRQVHPCNASIPEALRVIMMRTMFLPPIAPFLILSFLFISADDVIPTSPLFSISIDEFILLVSA